MVYIEVRYSVPLQHFLDISVFLNDNVIELIKISFPKPDLAVCNDHGILRNKL